MDLPDKIIGLDQLRIARGLEKFCKCDNRKFVLDTSNRRVTCSSCGAFIDPYDALHDLARADEERNRQVEYLLEQRKQIIDYKPHLLVIRNLEKQYRGKKMMPICPSCSEPFMLEELYTWVNWKFNEKRVRERIERSK
ncbi:hypothetical protein [Psychrobacillus sp. FSL K6-1464]|uniref:hypothetical protein n=1 Tax=Psychrobacillus sp. FSL K6-1464 TaxID=2921545 RepID=UPI004046B768